MIERPGKSLSVFYIYQLISRDRAYIYTQTQTEQISFFFNNTCTHAHDALHLLNIIFSKNVSVFKRIFFSYTRNVSKNEPTRRISLFVTTRHIFLIVFNLEMYYLDYNNKIFFKLSTR